MNVEKLSFWVAQIAPPLCLAWFIMPDEKATGPSLSFMAGMIWLFVFFSAISLLKKLFSNKSKKATLTRPLLTLMIASSVICFAFYTRTLAYQEMEVIYQQFKGKCLLHEACPAQAVGWLATKSESGTFYRKQVGKIYTYPLTYSKEADGFTLSLYIALDWDKNYRFSLSKPEEMNIYVQY